MQSSVSLCDLLTGTLCHVREQHVHGSNITAFSCTQYYLAKAADRACSIVLKELSVPCPLAPPARQLTVMSVFFVGHIHAYGVAQHLFGGLGPVIAWPLLMSSTVRPYALWRVNNCFIAMYSSILMTAKVPFVLSCLFSTIVTLPEEFACSMLRINSCGSRPYLLKPPRNAVANIALVSSTFRGHPFHADDLLASTTSPVCRSAYRRGIM